MTPTRTIRDARGVTRYFDVTPTRAVQWWWNRYERLWVVEVMDENDCGRSHGSVYVQHDGLERAIASAVEAIRKDPAGEEYRHY